MARLPQPGGDKGAWGTILNEYLSQSHNIDGTLKDGVVTSGNIAPNAVDISALGVSGGSDDQVLVKDSSSSTGLAWKTASGAVTSDASPSVKGIVQLTGDLGGTATSPTVPGLAAKADTSSLANYVPISQKGAASGVATLDGAGKVPSSQLPASTAPVSSVAGRTGDVLLTSSDVGLNNVDNTSDANKPISAATITALNAKAADTAVVHLTGAETVAGIKTFSSSPVVPTPTTSTQAANKTYVDSVAGAGAPDASPSVKGIVQLTGDLGGTATSPTVPGLAAKAADTAVVHLTGAETVAGIKTFSSSPVVPTPTTSTQAANKTYVDSVAGAGAPDASPSVKGIVQLTGDLGGTATSPTVPGLAAKADTSSLANYVPISQKGAASGVATLDGASKLTSSQIPSLVGYAALPANGGRETVSTANASGATTLNLNNGNVFNSTLTGNTTFSFSGATNGSACSFTLYLRQDATGSRTVSWPASVKWSGGAPSLTSTANAIDILVFESIDGGTTWFGSLVGANFS